MKQDQSQIRIWETFEANQSECPICSLEAKTKERLVESIFGETVMDYDFQRSLGHKNSFCKEHFLELYKANDKLGLAVIVDRILEHERQQIKKAGEKLEKPGLRKRLEGVLEKSKDKQKEELKREKCVLCRRIHEATHNSIKIMLDIWKKERSFRELYAGCNGFCMGHYERILETAAQGHMDKSLLEEFVKTTVELQLHHSERLHGELKWFIDKFDYRNADKSWGTSRDALYRALVKLEGHFEKPEE